MNDTKKKTLILGVGNVLLRDEGVGVYVVRALQERGMSDEVELLDGGTGGADLVEVFADRRKVVIVDALSSDDKPGSVLRFTISADTLADFRKEAGSEMSLHEVSVFDSLAMTKLLGCFPDEVVAIGIVPENITCGLGLTDRIEPLVDKVADLVVREIC